MGELRRWFLSLSNLLLSCCDLIRGVSLRLGLDVGKLLQGALRPAADVLQTRIGEILLEVFLSFEKTSQRIVDLFACCMLGVQINDVHVLPTSRI